jgi:RNA polymerase sigma factor (sigma-70 family)
LKPAVSSSAPGGDDEGFATFFRSAYPRLIAFLLARSGGSPAEAEDVAMEAFIIVFRNWPKIESPDAYVRMVGERLLMKSFARARREVDRAIVNEMLQVTEDSRVGLDEAGEVLALLRQLPPQQRRIMAWRIDGYSPGEISEMLSMNPETVRSHLRHARNALREALRERLDSAWQGSDSLRL